MAAPWKRRALALFAPLALAVALAAAVSGRGCDEGEAGPHEAVRLFLEAASELDRERMYSRLGPRTRGTLEAAAREATDRSSRRYSPAEMIGVDSGLEQFDLEGATDFISVIEMNEQTALVEIRDRSGATHRIALVRDDGRWLLELVANDN